MTTKRGGRTPDAPIDGTVTPEPLGPGASYRDDPRTEIRTAVARCSRCTWTYRKTGPALELARFLRAELLAHVNATHKGDQ